jgi:hypothetical protein
VRELACDHAGSIFAPHAAMRASVGLVHDMTVLAQLHAALDVVVETEATIRESGASSPAIERLGKLMGETRELLRSMLARHPAASGL